MMLGGEAMERLANSRVAVFGLGGVGGYVVEALARSGVGALDLIDPDKVCPSNLNRQILATRRTIGSYKADVAAVRVADIAPECKVRVYKTFFLPSTADEFEFSAYDYVVDAIDTVAGKLEIVRRAKSAGVPVISCMGAGNKLDATAFEVADIFKTSVCPLAKTMRRELKKLGIGSLKVVYSKEEPISPNAGLLDPEEAASRRSTPSSNAFVPAVAGLIAAGEVVKDLAGINK